MDNFESVLKKISLTTPVRRVEPEINFNRIYSLIPRGDLAGVDHVGLAAAKGLAVGPEIGIGTKGENFSWVNGTFGIVSAGWSGLKWVGASAAATNMGASGAV